MRNERLAERITPEAARSAPRRSVVGYRVGARRAPRVADARPRRASRGPGATATVALHRRPRWPPPRLSRLVVALRGPTSSEVVVDNGVSDELSRVVTGASPSELSFGDIHLTLDARTAVLVNRATKAERDCRARWRVVRGRAARRPRAVLRARWGCDRVCRGDAIPRRARQRADSRRGGSWPRTRGLSRRGRDARRHEQWSSESVNETVMLPKAGLETASAPASASESAPASASESAPASAPASASSSAPASSSASPSSSASASNSASASTRASGSASGSGSASASASGSASASVSGSPSPSARSRFDALLTLEARETPPPRSPATSISPPPRPVGRSRPLRRRAPRHRSPRRARRVPPHHVPRPLSIRRQRHRRSPPPDPSQGALMIPRTLLLGISLSLLAGQQGLQRRRPRRTAPPATVALMTEAPRPTRSRPWVVPPT